MADTHRVILTAGALRDLEDIAQYVHQHSPQNAAPVAETVLDAIDSLALMPARYRRVGKSRRRGSPVHAMVVRPFVVYFRVEDTPAVVYILTIRHGSRRQPRHFE
jgi:plasmid stabilization system protein ParE